MSERADRLNRRWLYIPFAIAGIILVAYYLLWRAGADQMKLAVHDWIADQRQSGMMVDHGPITSSGFPFFLRVHIDDPHIQSADAWRWRGKRLSLDALPYDLNKIIFSTVGEQFISAKNYGEWKFTAEDMRASIARDPSRDWVFSMNVGDATASRVDDEATVSLGMLVFDLAPDPEAKTTLTLNLAATQFDSNLNGEAYSLTTLQTAAAMSQTQLIALGTQPWRNGGGTLHIAGLMAELEETTFNASGDIKLDLDNRPTGRINAAIENPAGFARMLGKTGAMTHEEAEVAAAGLALLAFASGGKIEAPINLIDGTAQIGGVKIANIPPLE